MTELFGTFFGTMNYVRQGVVDFTIVKALLILTIPFAMAGSGLALAIDAGALQAVFGVALIILAAFMLWTNLRRIETPVGATSEGTLAAMPTGHVTVVQARDGRGVPVRPTESRHQPGTLCIWRVHHGPDELRAAGDQHRTACPEGPDTPTYRRWHIHYHPHRHGVLCRWYPRYSRRASMARGGVVDTGRHHRGTDRPAHSGQDTGQHYRAHAGNGVRGCRDPGHRRASLRLAS